jgi:hypothetical protein
MSQKHNQRTRTEILAKRNQPIEVIPVRHTMSGLIVTKKVKPGSKYMPHAGKKEQERAKRCYMEAHFPPMGEIVRPGFRTQFPRSAPTLCHLSKATHEAYLEAREQEYDSVF